MICVFCLSPTLIGIIFVFVQHEKNHKGQKVNINSSVKNNLKFLILIIESTRIFSINIIHKHFSFTLQSVQEETGIQLEWGRKGSWELEISHGTWVWAALWLWTGGAAAVDGASVLPLRVKQWFYRVTATDPLFPLKYAPGVHSDLQKVYKVVLQLMLWE